MMLKHIATRLHAFMDLLELVKDYAAKRKFISPGHSPFRSDFMYAAEEFVFLYGVDIDI